MNRKESFLFETFVRMSIQIIWIALGRKSFDEIGKHRQQISYDIPFNTNISVTCRNQIFTATSPIVFITPVTLPEFTFELAKHHQYFIPRSTNKISYKNFFINVHISELEVHRMFKSDLFNSAEHKLTGDKKIVPRTPHERQVLIGHCIVKKYKVDMMSPLINEVHCSKRNIDHRMFGLGIVQYPR